MSNAGTKSKKTPKKSIGGYLFFTFLMLAVAAGLAYYFKAPYQSAYIEDWQAWAGTDITNAGLLAICVALSAFGLIGAALNLMSRRHPEEIPSDHDLYVTEPAHGFSETNMAPAEPLVFEPIKRPEPRLQPRPSSDDGINTETREIREPARPTLMFDATTLPPTIANTAPAALASAMHQPIEILPAENTGPTEATELESLEPAVYAETPPAAETLSAEPISNVVPIRPEIVIPEAASPEVASPEVASPEVTSEVNAAPLDEPHVETTQAVATDPLAAALLAETAEIPSQVAPQSDINAVISSAMRFIDNQDATGFASDAPISPVMEVTSTEGLQIVESLPVEAAMATLVESPTVTDTTTETAAEDKVAPMAAAAIAEAPAPAPEPVTAPATMTAPTPVMTAWVEANTLDVPSAENEIKQATATALSAWPDQVRAIAADELQKRIALLHSDSAPACQRAFSLISAGELNAAAMTLHSHADSLAQAGAMAAAADIWRAYGALHMGRDDTRAMMAYEKVSELDRNDANIHLYLARRYQMSGESEKLAPVIERALRVVTDESTRFELLGPFADSKLKSGDLHSASQALEELSRLNQARVIKEPENVSAKSAYGISLAKLAQTREMMGITQMAGPLYKMAHEVFADLSTKIPTHTGLKSMADNALKDAERLNFA